MQAVGKLEHENLIRAHDAGEIDGLHYLALEYVEGVDLAKLVNGDPAVVVETTSMVGSTSLAAASLPPSFPYSFGIRTVADACELMRQAALGLEYAHAHGLIHRDIKPSNMLLTSSGKLKILDLGLARLLTDSPSQAAFAATALTQSGQILGTPDYMSPEQWDDTHDVDHRADLYSLGCTLFFLLTSRAPFADGVHNSMMSKMKAHGMGEIPDLKAARHAALLSLEKNRAPAARKLMKRLQGDEVPDDVVALYQSLMQKERSQRIASAKEIASKLSPITKRLRAERDARRNAGGATQSGTHAPVDVSKMAAPGANSPLAPAGTTAVVGGEGPGVRGSEATQDFPSKTDLEATRDLAAKRTPTPATKSPSPPTPLPGVPGRGEPDITASDRLSATSLQHDSPSDTTDFLTAISTSASVTEVRDDVTSPAGSRSNSGKPRGRRADARESRAPQPTASQSPPPNRRRLLIAAASVFAVLLLGVIIITIKHKDGTVTKIEVPDTAEVDVTRSSGGSPESVVPRTTPTGEPPVATASPLDLLDPAAIPADERFPWQPKELVGLIGTHRQRHWGQAAVVAFSPDGKLLASGGHDGIVKVFAVPSMEMLGEVRVADRGWVQALRFANSPPAGLSARLYFGASSDGGVGYIDVRPVVAQAARLSPNRPADPNHALPEGQGVPPQTQASRLSYDPSRRFKLKIAHPVFVALTALPEQRAAVNVAVPGLLILKAGGGEEKLIAWNTLTDEPTLLWERPTQRTSSNNNTAITEDGRRLAYLSAANAVTVLDLTTVPPREVQTLTVEQPISVGLTPDGRQLAVATMNAENSIVARWTIQEDAFTPLPIFERLPAGRQGFSLALAPNGQRLATSYTATRLWDFSATPPQPIVDLPSFIGPTYCLAMSPNGQHLALANSCGVVQCWDVSQLPPRELGHSGEREQGLTHADSRTVFAFATDRRMAAPGRLPSPNDQSLRQDKKAEGDQSTPRQASKKDKTIEGDHPTRFLDFVSFTQSDRHGVWRFDGKSPRFLESIPNSSFGALHGTQLFTSQSEHDITFNTLTAQGVVRGDTIPNPQRHYFRTSDDGALVYLSGPYCRDLHVVTTATKQVSKWFGMPGFVAHQQLTADGRRLALTTDADRATLQFWNYDGERGQLLGQVKAVGSVTQLALSPDRQRLLAGCNTGLDLFDVREMPPKSLFQETDLGYHGAAFSPDGQHFAYCGATGRLVIRDTATLKLVREWKLPGDLSKVIYAPDGRHLVLLNGNGTAYILRLSPISPKP